MREKLKQMREEFLQDMKDCSLGERLSVIKIQYRGKNGRIA